MRAPEVGVELEPLDCAASHFGREATTRRLPRGLGQVHRHVGVAQQIFDGRRRCRVAMPTLAPDVTSRPAIVNGRAGLGEPVRERARRTPPRSSVHENRELVTAEAARQVSAGGRREQRGRAARAASRRRGGPGVVDGLEVVEVQEQQRDAAAGPRRCDRVRRSARSRTARGCESRQRVVEGLMGELGLELASLGDVVDMSFGSSVVDIAHFLVDQIIDVDPAGDQEYRCRCRPFQGGKKIRPPLWSRHCCCRSSIGAVLRARPRVRRWYAAIGR